MGRDSSLYPEPQSGPRSVPKTLFTSRPTRRSAQNESFRSLAILFHMGKEIPNRLQQAREFCRGAGIEVYAWGPDTLTVRAESPERTKQAISQLRSLGFEPIEDEDDTQAGILLLSRNPVATRANQSQSRASFDLSKQPLVRRVAPAFEAALSIACFWFSTTQAAPKSWFDAAMGSIFPIIFLWDGGRVWGWGLRCAIP